MLVIDTSNFDESNVAPGIDKKETSSKLEEERVSNFDAE
jgi:hypothetical protein